MILLFDWMILRFHVKFWGCTLPETNSKFAPEHGLLLEEDEILRLGQDRPIFRGKLAVSFRDGSLC